MLHVMLPVTGVPAVELDLHVSYRAGVFRPVALQKLALLLQMGQANHSGTHWRPERRKSEGQMQV